MSQAAQAGRGCFLPICFPGREESARKVLAGNLRSARMTTCDPVRRRATAGTFCTMTTAGSDKAAQVKAHRRDWAPRIWEGCDFFAWLNLLFRNRFAVHSSWLYIA